MNKSTTASTSSKCYEENEKEKKAGMIGDVVLDRGDWHWPSEEVTFEARST